MNKCCKCKLCQSYENAIQIGKCPFVEDIKKEQKKYYLQLKEAKVVDDMFNKEIQRLTDKQLACMDRKIDHFRKELDDKIDERIPDFYIGGVIVVVMTILINLFI